MIAASAMAVANAQQYYYPFQRQPAAPYTHYAKPAAPDLSAHHDRAEASMLNGDYAEAYCVWKPLADKGDIHAQYSLGWMYHNGYGLSINDKEAERWWKAAAEKGDADANYALAVLYVDRPRKTRDVDSALPLLVRAASKGHDDAKDLLADLSSRGYKGAQEAIVKLFLAAPTQAGEKRLVKGASVNFRAGPGTSDDIVAKLKEGDALIILARKGKWYQAGVLKDKTVGWIYASLTKAVEKN